MRLSAFIKANVRIIVDDWEQFARTLIPEGSRMDSLALRDHAKQILLAMADDIASWQSTSDSVDKSHGWNFKAARSAETAAEVHGALRQQHGFNMVQLAAEFRALRSSVLRLWGTRSDDSVSYAEDTLRFNEAIDQALAESIDKFMADVDRGRNLFLGILGHDIKTPLSTVTLTAATLARQHEGDETELKLVRRIQRNVGTITSVITDLLEFVRLDLGSEMTLHRSVADLAEVAVTAIDDYSALHPSVEIRFAPSGDVMGAWDDIRMRQLLLTLIDNAVTSGPQESVIFVRVGRRDNDAVVTVENEGPELPAATTVTLFDPLVREDAKRPKAASEAKLGIDLYIARQIVLAHGGVISAGYQAGKNCVTVVLPVQQLAKAPQSPQEA
jgi:signal transduction histidine kinase